jgi:nucleolar protein 56
VEERDVKATIVESVMGFFGFDETNKLIQVVLFPKDPVEIAERLRKIEAGILVEEIIALIKDMQGKDYETFIFEDAEIAQKILEKSGVNVEVVKPSEAGDLLRANLDKFAVEVGFVKEPGEIREWLRKVSTELTKMRVKRAGEKRDLVAAQAIQTVDDLDKTLNLFMSRVREWYGLHFPELDRLVEKHETYARLVANLGRRENFTQEKLKEEGLPKAKAEEASKAAQKSMGAELEEEDLEQIQVLCKNTLALYDIRHSLDNYLDSTMEEVAPNIRTLAGSLLGARLIALAGGLGNLAKMPASTIQVLGAEKALFRSIRSGARPPKHGMIFQHPSIHEAKRWQRGKVARTLAGRLAIAARIDAFSGRYMGDKLKEDLEKRIRDIQARYERPPTPLLRLRPRRRR